MLVNEKQWTWNRWLDHVSMRRIFMLNKLNLVVSIINLKFYLDALCEACPKGKFSKTPFKAKNVFSPIVLWNSCIDLFGSVKTASINDK